jgi:magnesium-protoporphyrin IX monomethyl ester (oxidative) cyclase
MRMKILEELDLTPQCLPEFLRQVRKQARSFVESCVDHIVCVNPRILGFSMMFCQVCSSLAIARKIKQELGAEAPKVVFGGSNCEGTMGHAMLKAFPWVDYVCCGEGDKAFVELASCLLEDKEPRVQGIVGRHKNVLDEFSTLPPIRNMNELPFPDFED